MTSPAQDQLRGDAWPRVKLICFGRGDERTGERILEFGQSISLPPGTRWLQIIGMSAEVQNGPAQ